jgi:hypothetical protein
MLSIFQVLDTSFTQCVQTREGDLPHTISILADCLKLQRKKLKTGKNQFTFSTALTEDSNHNLLKVQQFCG